MDLGMGIRRGTLSWAFMVSGGLPLNEKYYDYREILLQVPKYMGKLSVPV